jgi:hypothetical protein
VQGTPRPELLLEYFYEECPRTICEHVYGTINYMQPKTGKQNRPPEMYRSVHGITPEKDFPPRS